MFLKKSDALISSVDSVMVRPFAVKSLFIYALVLVSLVLNIYTVRLENDFMYCFSELTLY